MKTKKEIKYIKRYELYYPRQWKRFDSLNLLGKHLIELSKVGFINLKVKIVKEEIKGERE